MELWVTGLNAWNQLNCENQGDHTSNPEDLHDFQCVLKDENIDVLRTSVSSLLIKTSSGFLVTGSPDELISFCIEKQDHFHNLAAAGNDKIATCIDGILTQFDDLSAYKSSHGKALRPFGRVRQVVANQTTFTALSSSGTVYTWGDARFEACLARKPSEICAASEPCLVEDLLDLPTGKIHKLASGGYYTAALTSGNDIYLWGGRPGQPKILKDLEEFPTPVDVDGIDWVDVGVGQDHVIALSTEGQVWVLGENQQGQLGLGGVITRTEEWQRVNIDLGGKQITKVYAGYKNSMLIVE